MTIELTAEEFNLIMNLLDAHVENLKEWVATEEDQDMVKERDEAIALFTKLNEEEMLRKAEEANDYRESTQ
jgi:hypothetical protein